MSLVEVDELEVSFGSNRAVRGVSFAIGRGERLGLIGESGSGKSLTALALAGLLPETAKAAGTVSFEGAVLPTSDAAMARLRAGRIGMIFQEPMTALNPLMRVGKQIAEAAMLAGKTVRSDINRLLDEVGLGPEHADRYPHQLSGGQRQRVMIALALAGQPELMIADEPTSALDVITQRIVIELIDAVCSRRNMALLFISHDIKVVAALCDRIAVLRNGQIVEMGTKEVVVAAPTHDYTRALLAASRLDTAYRPATKRGSDLLEVKDVTRVYRRRNLLRRRELRAVDGVSFSVQQGECVALVGPSGCGKTTLARLIVGLDAPSSGTLTLRGTRYDPSQMDRTVRSQMSLVFQDPFASFDPRMTIEKSVGEPLHLVGGLAPSQRRQRVKEAVEAVGLAPSMMERYPHEFSGGQRQRLSIARALVTRPSLVVLDEPVSALDVSVRGEILALLARLQDEFELTYLLISHDLDLVGAVADRVLVMDAGRIVEKGRPTDIFAAPQHPLTQALVNARLPALA